MALAKGMHNQLGRANRSENRAFLLLLMPFIVGNLWFHFTEAILRRIKRLFTRHKKPPAWHPLPPDKED